MQIISGVDIKAFDKLLASHKELAAHLCKRSSEDQAYDVGTFASGSSK